ncbi:metallophosphoesterase [Metabacillus sp. 113a]|uniref:metallophosphoesterase n=1 Tax=Metabacillus sp. 113a TaxID=3404706 RepID=UPI003CF899DA
MTIFLIGAVLGALCLAAYMLSSAFRSRITIQNLSYSDFPPDHGKLKIFFISDIHRRKISDNLLANLPAAPDIICIGGDLTEKGVPIERTRENVKRLCETARTVMVLGNNDPEAGLSSLEHLLEEEGAALLKNKTFPIPSRSGKQISLLGVDEMKFGWDRLDLVLRESQESDFRILLCHNPEIAKKLTPETGIRLVLSGHTHGGQIRMLGFGLYEKGKIHKKPFGDLLISNGFGTTQLPLRLGAPAEAHFLTITSSKK